MKEGILFEMRVVINEQWSRTFMPLFALLFGQIALVEDNKRWKIEELDQRACLEEENDQRNEMNF